MDLGKKWEAYNEYLREIKWPFTPLVWVLISVIVAIGFSSLVAIIFFVLKLVAVHWIHAIIMTTIVLIVLVDIMISYPYLKAIKRIEKIETALPDALKQMADTLKAGGTFEFALRGISSSEYGPLTEEMNLVLRRLQEGENLEQALKSFSRNVKSRIVERAMNIILDSIAAGASLADILDEISDDIKATQRIIDERKGSTLMQVLFMVTAGVIVSPFIFGLVISILNFLMSQTPAGMTGTLDQEATMVCSASLPPEAYWLCVTDAVMLFIVVYIIVETIAIGLMISLIREGKITKSFIYIPILLLMSYSVFFAANVITLGFFGA